MAALSLDRDVLALSAELTETRRVIHRHPELGFQEVRTSGLVAQRLRALGLAVTEGVARTGVVGLLEGGRPGKTILLRAGPVMASMDTIGITVRGRGGHGALPHQTVDAIVVAAHVVTALQTLASREISPTVPVVVSLGTIHGGFRHNVIAPEVSLTGTVRTYDEGLRKTLPERIERIVGQVCQAFRGEGEVRYELGYPVTVNDPAMTTLCREVATAVVGPERVQTLDAMMGSEDMAYFLQAVPGCFLFLGSSSAAKGLTAPHHSAEFDFDEACLPIGVQLLVRLVERALEPH